jgi:hypothetical protein
MAEERAAFQMTERNQEVFSFASHFSRRVEASFTAVRQTDFKPVDGSSRMLRTAPRHQIHPL